MKSISSKQYYLLFVIGTIVLSMMAIVVSTTILGFPPQLNTDIDLYGYEQTARTILPIWLVFVFLETFSLYAENTYKDLLIDIISASISIFICSIGMYFAIILLLYPANLASFAAFLTIIAALIIIFIVIYRRKTINDTIISVFKVCIHKWLDVIFVVSFILGVIFLLEVAGVILYETKGNTQSDSKQIAETIAFDKDYFSLSPEDKFQLYADFIASEATRLGIDSSSLKVRPTLYDGDTYAFYDSNEETVYININSPMPYYGGDYPIKPLLHELFHVYQFNVQSGKISPSNLDYGLSEHIDQWRSNAGNYMNGDEDIYEYAIQPLEIDARSFAQQRSSELIDVKEYLRANI